MPIAFSTLGCPDADLGEVIRLAHQHNIDGLEVRVAEGGILNETMTPSERKCLKEALSRSGLQVLCLGTYVKLCSPDDDGIVARLRRNILLAADVGAKGVRIFPGAGTVPAMAPGTIGDRERLGASRLGQVIDLAEEMGVKLLLETHDSHPTGADVARILAHFPGSKGIGAIWDVLHPWRHGEDPAETLRQLGSSLDYVQLKDAYLRDDTSEVELVLPGTGQIPLSRITNLLAEAGFVKSSRWFSLEWEKAWHPELPEISQALPYFLSTMTRVRED